MSNKPFMQGVHAVACVVVISLIGVSPTAAVAVPAAATPSPTGATNEAHVEQAPAAMPQETIDQYARRLLDERMAAPKEDEPQRRPNAGQMGPAQFELIYITGVGKAARAMIRLDKQYAKLAGSGEALAGWTLSDIGPDYVDIYKDEEQARIYLFSSRQSTRGS